MMSSGSSEVLLRGQTEVDGSRPTSALSGPGDTPEDVMRRQAEMEQKLHEEAGRQTDLLRQLVTLQGRPTEGPDQDRASGNRFTPSHGGVGRAPNHSTTEHCTNTRRLIDETSLSLPGSHLPRVPQSPYRPDAPDWENHTEWEPNGRRLAG